MDKQFKFALPSPNFNKNNQDACKPKPHYLTPSGMSLLPREKQPPPMYGKHGATLPGRYLKSQVVKDQQSADTLNPPEIQYCEPCELELHSLEELKRHRAQHEKCPVAGCLYKGHPSVMDKHVIALHASGLFDKFKKLSTPEEIAAWREERRKRYPTLANVLLKQKAKEQRQKRGERLENSKNRFGKVNDRKRAQLNTVEDKSHIDEKRRREENKPNYGNKKNRKNKNNKKSKKQEFKPKVQNDVKQKNEKLEVQTESSCGGIEMFRGTSNLKNYNHFTEKKKAGTNNVLFGLVGMYGSDDDDESEENYGDNENNVEEIKIFEGTEKNETNSDIFLESCTVIDDENKILPDNQSNEEHIVKETKYAFSKSPTHNSSLLDAPLIENVRDPVIIEPIETCTSNQNVISSDEGPEEMPIQRSMSDKPLKTDSNPKITPVEESEAKHSKLSEQRTISKHKQLKKRKFGLDYRNARLRKQNTMLEKLLESDMRHERNVLLQCVRYVCENNFFNVGQNKNQESLDKNKL